MAHSELRSVVSITLVDDTGCTTIYKAKKGKKRQQSMGVDGLGDAQKQAMKTAVKMGKDYIRRHERSNRRQKDGWLVDFATNVMKSAPDMMKEARKQALR